MPPEGGPAQTARSWLTWALAFGLGRRVIRGAARRGDLVGRLELDPALREDPFPACGPGVASEHGEPPLAAAPPARRGLRRRRARAGRPTVDAGRGPALPHPLPQVGVAGLQPARAVRALEERTRETAEELLDQVSARGRDRVAMVETYVGQRSSWNTTRAVVTSASP